MNRSRQDDLVYWAIWAFALAFIVVILATAIAAGREALATTSSRSETLSAPSADAGSTMEASPACVGVCTPGSSRLENENAVESILSHDLRWTASWCGFGDKTILQCLAMAFATMLPARGPSDFAFFPGVTVQFSGADVLPFLIRESDTASCRAQAAPGNLLPRARPNPHTASLQNSDVYRAVAAAAVRPAPGALSTTEKCMRPSEQLRSHGRAPARGLTGRSHA